MSSLPSHSSLSLSPPWSLSLMSLNLLISVFNTAIFSFAISITIHLYLGPNLCCCPHCFHCLFVFVCINDQFSISFSIAVSLNVFVSLPLSLSHLCLYILSCRIAVAVDNSIVLSIGIERWNCLPLSLLLSLSSSLSLLLSLSLSLLYLDCYLLHTQLIFYLAT